MKIEYAYSLEIGEYLHAEDAHEQYWQGKLTDKQLFVCIADNCSAEITCANMEKLRTEMKVSPYFTTRSKHHTNCSEVIKWDTYVRQGLSGEEYGNLSKDVVRVAMQRPASHKQVTKVSQEAALIQKREKLNEFQSRATSDNRIPTRYSIRPLVVSFKEYSEGQLKKKKVLVKNNTYTYEELFESVEEGKILTSSERIYHGKVWVLSFESGVSFSFFNKCRFNGFEGQPRIFIGNKIVQDSIASLHWKKKIEHILQQKKPVATVYALASPEIKVFNDKSGKIQQGIQFPVRNLDFIDIY